MISGTFSALFVSIIYLAAQTYSAPTPAVASGACASEAAGDACFFLNPKNESIIFQGVCAKAKPKGLSCGNTTFVSPNQIGANDNVACQAAKKGDVCLVANAKNQTITLKGSCKAAANGLSCGALSQLTVGP